MTFKEYADFVVPKINDILENAGNLKEAVRLLDLLADTCKDTATAIRMEIDKKENICRHFGTLAECREPLYCVKPECSRDKPFVQHSHMPRVTTIL